MVEFDWDPTISAGAEMLDGSNLGARGKDLRLEELDPRTHRRSNAERRAQYHEMMDARAAVRDVGRVMGMPYQDVDKVAKLIPTELKMTLNHALEVSPDLKAMYDAEPQVHELIDTSLKVEGMPRHASTHAAGV